MTDWQPIETAPKDGTRILLLTEHDVLCGSWNGDEYAKNPRPYWDNDKSRIMGALHTRKFQPTHWMPLPEPPINWVSE